MIPILKVTNLNKRYGNLLAVRKMSFTVNKGEVLGIVGPNGSGKTTLFSMLLNLVKPSSGSIRIFNQERIALVKKRIGATLDISFFYPYLNAYDHLNIVSKIKGVDKRKIKEKLELVGLWGRHQDAVKKYSMGMKQRLAIAIALLNDPELVILDEPTNGLDPRGIMDVRQIILETAQRGATVLVSSHILSEIEKTCTRILMIQKGKIINEIHTQGEQSTDPFFELAAYNMEMLGDLLENSDLVSQMKHTDEKFVIKLADSNKNTDNLMRYLSQHEVYPNHFVKKGTDLERLFLEK